MTTRTKRRVLSASLTLALSCPCLTAPSRGQDEPAPRTVDRTKAKWLPLLQRHATEYEIVSEGADGKKVKATILPSPLMRWTQPVRGGDDGVLCLWLDRGRPVVAMTIFTFKGGDGLRYIVHEHQSLSPSRLVGTWRGDEMWHTEKPGLAFEPIPDAPKPAASASARLRQMQAMTRDFSANTIDNKDSTWPLRPLAKPLYRYEGTGPEVADGALFTLVQGTDPEAFLLLEARPDTDGKESRWYFAAARLTDLRLRVRLKNREVLSVPYAVGAENETYQTKTVQKKASDSPEDFEKP